MPRFVPECLLIVALAAPAPQDVAVDAQPPSSLVAESEHFAFHSHPWIGLHHFLYELGTAAKRRSSPPTHGRERRLWSVRCSSR